MMLGGIVRLSLVLCNKKQVVTGPWLGSRVGVKTGAGGVDGAGGVVGVGGAVGVRGALGSCVILFDLY